MKKEKELTPEMKDKVFQWIREGQMLMKELGASDMPEDSINELVNELAVKCLTLADATTDVGLVSLTIFTTALANGSDERRADLLDYLQHCLPLILIFGKAGLVKNIRHDNMKKEVKIDE